MYKCTKCYEVFDEPDSKTICYEDYYGVGSMFDTRHTTEILICPYCSDEDIEDVGKVMQCSSCKEWFNEDDLYIADETRCDCDVYLCEKCYEELEEKENE